MSATSISDLDICRSIIPKLLSLDKRIEDNEKHLSKLDKDVADIRKETAAMKIEINSRYWGSRWLKSLAAVLIFLSLLQIIATVWWEQRTAEFVRVTAERISSLDRRISQSEMLYKNEHPFLYK